MFSLVAERLGVFVCFHALANVLSDVIVDIAGINDM